MPSPCPHHPLLPQIYKEGRVILALLTLAEPPKSTTELRSTSRHWSSVQQEDLQLQALATLTTIAPLMLDDYMSYQGNARLLLLLDWCTGKGEQREVLQQDQDQNLQKTSRISLNLI